MTGDQKQEVFDRMMAYHKDLQELMAKHKIDVPFRSEQPFCDVSESDLEEYTEQQSRYAGTCYWKEYK